MKNFVFVTQILLLSVSISLSATTVHPKGYQVAKPKPKLSSDIKLLFESEEYQKIVDWYAEKPQILSVENLTYIAQAYLNLDDLDNAGSYADMAILKNPRYAKAYYIKGVISAMTNDDETALIYFQKASIQEPQEALYYTLIGDMYLAQENYTEALVNYNKAVELPQYSEKAYYLIGVVYATQNKEREALDAFYIAKAKVLNDKELYVTILYNIGSMEFKENNYKKAIAAYKELVDYLPDDYYSFEKLVQCHYALGQYSSGDVYKKRLYNAFKKEKLVSTSISDMFCIDQFTVDSKQVSAYERYAEQKEFSFVKNIFYIINNNGDIESTITIEYFPERNEDTEGIYKLFITQGANRYGYDRVFDANVRYSTLKAYIAEIVEGKVKPKE